MKRVELRQPLHEKNRSAIWQSGFLHIVGLIVM